MASRKQIKVQFHIEDREPLTEDEKAMINKELAGTKLREILVGSSDTTLPTRVSADDLEIQWIPDVQKK